MAEGRMELFIETLTGTAFELSCSPWETIVSIKAKIQCSEGIPVQQQHLVWGSRELKDDRSLRDYGIGDGATLRLVLAVKGGPLTTDTKKFKDLSDLVERNSAGSEGRPLTVLVFHEGDRVHMYYTLVKRGSPTTSEAPSVVLPDVEEQEATREKVAQLQEQLRALNISRTKRTRLPPIAPPINSPPALPLQIRESACNPPSKKRKRCSQCSRKTGLATSYTCRCGKNFCASHRYAEVHHCTYDYKTEGRRLLQLNNPVVTASKLPKI